MFNIGHIMSNFYKLNAKPEQSKTKMDLNAEELKRAFTSQLLRTALFLDDESLFGHLKSRP